MYNPLSLSLSLYIYIYMLCISLSLYIHIYIHTYIHTYTYIYIYIYIYIFVHFLARGVLCGRAALRNGAMAPRSPPARIITSGYSIRLYYIVLHHII